ncbi:MAG: NUDIX hydrolase [Spirochaetes bacterium]|nr:NUDIX hydrolase [Spirochaetota bacterium]
MIKKFQIRVSGISFIKKKLILLTHKKKDRCYWVFPGGRVEFAEKAEEAVIREYREELNVKAKVVRFLFYNESLPPDYPVHSLNLFFLVKPITTDIRLEKNGVIQNVQLFEKNKIKDILLFPKINNKIMENFEKWVEDSK